MISPVATIVHQRNADCYPDGPQLTKTISDFDGQRRQTRKLALETAGIKHQVAEALLRLPTTCVDQTVLGNDLPIHAIEGL